MTPFELSLQNDLSVETEKFANEWLLKWHGMTYEGGVTDVDDFCGGRIHYSGIKFGYQQEQILLDTVRRYLDLKMHETFKRWDQETRQYPAELRRSSLSGTEQCFSNFVTSIMTKTKETQKALGGKSWLTQLLQKSNTLAEIETLGHAYRTLMEKSVEKRVPSQWEELESFLSNRKGTLGLIGVMLALIFGLWRIFVGWFRTRRSAGENIIHIGGYHELGPVLRRTLLFACCILHNFYYTAVVTCHRVVQCITA